VLQEQAVGPVLTDEERQAALYEHVPDVVAVKGESLHRAGDPPKDEYAYSSEADRAPCALARRQEPGREAHRQARQAQQIHGCARTLVAGELVGLPVDAPELPDHEAGPGARSAAHDHQQDRQYASSSHRSPSSRESAAGTHIYAASVHRIRRPASVIRVG
jgi:hypothetical protein